MALFRRNNSANSPALPEEVNNYYQAEKRDRTWMAWLLALLSLAVTTLIIMGLFFGGRWIYRKIRPSNQPVAPIAGNQTNDSPAPASNGDANNQGGGTEPSQQEKEEEERRKAEEQRKKEEEEKRKEQERARVNAPVSPTPTAQNPGTGSGPATTTTPNTNSDLPETGPGDVIAVFMLTTAAGALVHRYVLRQVNN
jgi:hypothetical protein